jgi:hypothetical protein
MIRLFFCILLLALQCTFYKAQGEFFYLKNDTINSSKPNNYYEWILREIRNIIIVQPKDSITDSVNIFSPIDIYTPYEGQTITNIRIIRLDPFGTSVYDVDIEPKKNDWFGRIGNSVHINTREIVIRNMLLFKEGDVIERHTLAYTEQYIRKMNYINNARIVVLPISDYSVEVVVIVQDNFPYSADGSTNLLDQANVSLYNRNVLGLGLDLQFGTFINTQKDDVMGYTAVLRLPNINRSFISLNAYYLDKYEEQRIGVNFKREFYSPATKYAGFVDVYTAQLPVRYRDLQSQIDTTVVKYDKFDTWLGRSFLLPNKKMLYRNITLSVRGQNIHFVKRPPEVEEHYYIFQNRRTYLASVSYSKQSFFKATHIYNFGRTEDIPYGDIFTITTGGEIGEFYRRPYLGAAYSTGHFIWNFGYLSGTINYGTFFNKSHADQGIIDIESNYFTNLFIIGLYRCRTFLKAQYTAQIYNKLEDYLRINGIEQGIPGFRNDSIIGRQRLNFSIEQNVFMPREFYGFRFVLYGFAHLSWLGGYEEKLKLENTYQSIGIGVRLRNNRLVFNTVQLQLAYFPNIPNKSRFKYFDFSSEKVLYVRGLTPQAPDIVQIYEFD